MSREVDIVEVADQETGRTYYVDTRTQVRAWTRSELLEGVPLPAGVVAATDPETGCPYFIDVATSRVGWSLEELKSDISWPDFDDDDGAFDGDLRVRGVLMKKGRAISSGLLGRRRNWLFRHFRLDLTSDHLLYYGDADCEHKKGQLKLGPKTTVKIGAVKIGGLAPKKFKGHARALDAQSAHYFVIDTEDNGHIELRAKDATQLDEWCRSLLHVVQTKQQGCSGNNDHGLTKNTSNKDYIDTEKMMIKNTNVNKQRDDDHQNINKDNSNKNNYKDDKNDKNFDKNIHNNINGLNERKKEPLSIEKTTPSPPPPPPPPPAALDETVTNPIICEEEEEDDARVAAKYKRMLGLGLSQDAVEHKMRADGKGALIKAVFGGGATTPPPPLLPQSSGEPKPSLLSAIHGGQALKKAQGAAPTPPLLPPPGALPKPPCSKPAAPADLLSAIRGGKALKKTHDSDSETEL